MRSAGEWCSGDYDQCTHGREELDSCATCYPAFIRAIQKDAVTDVENEVAELREDLAKGNYEEFYFVLQKQYKAALDKVSEVEKRAEAAERVVMFARFLANHNRKEIDTEEFVDCGLKLSEAIEKYDALKKGTTT